MTTTKISRFSRQPLCGVILLLVLFCTCTKQTAVRRPVEHRRPPIIDIHAHAFQFNRLGDPPPPNPVSGAVPAARTDEEAIDAYLAEMKRYNIVKAYVSGALDMVAKWISAAPGRIIGGPLFPVPATPWPEPDLLRSEYMAGRLGLMGEIGAQYAGVAPNDPLLEPYFALAEELDIPACFHTGLSLPGIVYKGYPEFRATLGNPLLLEEVLIRHPKLRLYIAHGGRPYLQETIAILNMYPQVYVDISVINWIIPREEFHYYLRRLIQAGFGKRIMFGSDQIIWPDAVGMAIEGIESADFLTEQQKRDIFYNNAARFLRLNGDVQKYSTND